ncbi:unnamed protein product (mitochondrion) [Plasmodiophora brassicae]|uniref:Uncharacterized protein n=1 Tax=Plasmodiophora brassicae TaxID=37360 RepID=A0A0G4J0V8_PLABS|nr:hypothetical protein PBRA_001860 [Plasmodiophora brassicae]SPR01292.1 unnamed protein product [Plasmodiophora brassicae]
MGAESSRLREQAAAVRSAAHVDLTLHLITDDALPCLCQAIAGSRTLTRLTLSRNLIRDSGAQYIALAVARSTTLQVLDLSWNAIGSPGAIALAEALTLNRSLRTLNLFGNRIGDDGAEVIERAIEASVSRSHLTSIDLGFNGIRSGLLDRLSKTMAQRQRRIRKRVEEAGATRTRSSSVRA